MHFLRWQFPLAVASAILVGCAGHAVRVSPGLSATNSTDGWIVGTIGSEKSPFLERKGSTFNDHALYFARKGSNDGGRIGFNRGELFGSDKDFNDSIDSSNIFVQRLPAGDYAFVQAEFWTNRGMWGTTTLRGYLPSPVAFSVKSGTATYIGSFVATNEWPPGQLKSNPGNGFFFVMDRSERDITVIRKAHPELPPEVTISVVDPGEGKLPLRRAAASQ